MPRWSWAPGSPCPRSGPPWAAKADSSRELRATFCAAFFDGYKSKERAPQLVRGKCAARRVRHQLRGGQAPRARRSPVRAMLGATASHGRIGQGGSAAAHKGKINVSCWSDGARLLCSRERTVCALLSPYARSAGRHASLWATNAEPLCIQADRRTPSSWHDWCCCSRHDKHARRRLRAKRQDFDS